MRSSSKRQKQQMHLMKRQTTLLKDATPKLSDMLFVCMHSTTTISFLEGANFMSRFPVNSNLIEGWIILGTCPGSPNAGSIDARSYCRVRKNIWFALGVTVKGDTGLPGTSIQGPVTAGACCKVP